MKDFFKKYKIPIIFIVFFLIIFLEHQFMWLYHDDYGYASLSYAFNVDGVNGHTFNLSQLFSFLIGHYNNWGGRVLYFGIECFLLSKSLFLFKLVQSIVITFIFYYLYKILKKYTKINDYILAILSVCCYGFIEIMVVNSGIFWPTASILYIFPLLPLLMFIYYYDSNNKKIFHNILMGLLIFLAAFSQEQIAVATVAYIGIVTIYEFFKTKRINKLNIIMILVALIGFAILMLAPGTKVRMNHPSSGDFYTLSLFGKIYRNYPNLIINIFSHYSKIFIMLFVGSITYLSYKNLKNKSNILNKISLLSTLIVLVLTIVSTGTYFEVMYDLFSSTILKIGMLGLFTIQLLLMIYSLIIYFIKEKKYLFIWIILIAILSQAAMIVAPYYPLRSVIIFEILFYITIVYCICDFIDKKRNKYLIVIPLIFVSLFNLFTITRGYYRNNEVNKENDETLIKTSKDIKNGKSIETINLRKLPDLTYSGDQPYIGNNDYILTWVKEYYDLPSDIKIVYEEEV